MPSLDVLSFIPDLVADLARQDTTAEQRRDFMRMGWALLRHDPGFVWEALEALKDLLGPPPSGAPPQADLGIVELAGPGAGDPLPTSLVTPRVLLEADWLEWVHPLEPA